MTTQLSRMRNKTYWETKNPILRSGEPGFEGETGKLKIGDGITAWNSLPYQDVAPYVLPQSESFSWSSSSSSLDADDKLLSALADRQVRPVRLAFVGSSTTATAGASGYVQRLVTKIQAVFPSGGVEAAVQASTTATFTPSNSPGVQGFNAGIGGTNADTYLTGGAGNNIAKISALNPDAVIHMIGSNDYAGNRNPATYKTDILSTINAFHALIPNALHVLIHSYKRLSPSSTTYPWSDYGKALAEIANADPTQIVFVDLSELYVPIGVPGADPANVIDTDGIHQTDAGHWLMAEAIKLALRIPTIISAVISVPTPNAVIVSDDFNRADGALGTALSGQTWTGAGLTLVSGQVSATGSANGFIETGVTDQDVSATIIAGSSTTTVGINFNANDSSNRLVFYRTADGTPSLAKFQGSSTVVTLIANNTDVVAPGEHNFRVVSKGAVIKCYIDDVLIYTYTLTAGEQTHFKPFTKAGIRISAIGPHRVDNFAVSAAI